MRPPNVADDAHKAARQLESYFLKRVLTEVKTSENSISGGGFAGDTFKDMFDDAISDAMTKGGGVGLADVIAKQLDPKKKAAGSADAAAPADAAPKKSEGTNRPIPLPHAEGMPLHRVSPLVTDPLGNRAFDAQAPATTGIPLTPPAVPGSVSLRRYRAADPSDPPPSSLLPSGRTTNRR